jgi:hypothetical protein
MLKGIHAYDRQSNLQSTCMKKSNDHVLFEPGVCRAHRNRRLLASAALAETHTFGGQCDFPSMLTQSTLRMTHRQAFAAVLSVRSDHGLDVRQLPPGSLVEALMNLDWPDACVICNLTANEAETVMFCQVLRLRSCNAAIMRYEGHVTCL